MTRLLDESKHWRAFASDVWVYGDSCTVYALLGPGGTVIVNAGTGAWLDRVQQLPAPPAALLCTHYFRDHSAGAARAAEHGIPVYVPEGEIELFTDPVLHFQRRPSLITYDNTWDHFGPIHPIEVAGPLGDYENRSFAGIDLVVVPLPGVTITQAGFELVLADGRRAVLCGEAIHSGGRLARVAPLQYGYVDLPGAAAAIATAIELRRRKPDVLLPSIGQPIVNNVDGELSALERNLRGLATGRWGEPHWRLLDADPLVRVTESVWRTTGWMAASTFILAPSGKVAAIDLGYDLGVAGFGQASPARHRRRGTLRSVFTLLERTGRQRLDLVLPSHFHDDHVASIPLAQRLYGTECWCPETFADLLERPLDYAFPCIWPDPISVDRRLPCDEPIVWEGIEFRFAPMSGHTRFSAAICFEIDGIRYAHTGDQYHLMDYFERGWPLPGDYQADWRDDAMCANHVYRNGAHLSSYAESAQLLETWRPDVVLTGHQPAMWTDEAFFERVREWTQAYESMHRNAMVLGEDEEHFGLDSWGGWIRPYRIHRLDPGVVNVTATVRNPLPRAALLELRLVGPAGVTGQAITRRVEGRVDSDHELSLSLSTSMRREPIALELTVDGRPYGQVAEALVTIGHPRF